MAIRIFALLCVPVLVVALALTTSSATAGDAPVSEGSLKAVTFNIRYGTADDGPNAWPHRREMVIDLLRDMDADVIGLQEALRFQLDEIEAALPGYVEIGVGRNDGLTAGEYAPLLVRSERFAVAAAGTFWLSDTPEEPGSRSWGNGIPRICTWARLIEKSPEEGQAAAVWVYVVHMDHISAGSRQRGAELIAAQMRDRPAPYADEPIMLMGDFNTGEATPPLQFLRGEIERASEEMWPGYEPPKSPKLVEAFRAVHPDAQEVGTFTAFRIGATTGEKIDHLLVSKGAKVLDAGIDRTSRDGRYPSDHFPVWAVVKF
jgi:endonuclease/exonuclease/phosphatase family metal-dependent hydrolase